MHANIPAGHKHEVCKVRAGAEEEQETGGEADSSAVSIEGRCAAHGSRWDQVIIQPCLLVSCISICLLGLSR